MIDEDTKIYVRTYKDTQEAKITEISCVEDRTLLAPHFQLFTFGSIWRHVD
jgi:hypothetical protein